MKTLIALLKRLFSTKTPKSNRESDINVLGNDYFDFDSWDSYTNAELVGEKAISAMKKK